MSELDNQLTALANAIREIATPEGTGAMSLDDMATLLGAAESPASGTVRFLPVPA